MKRKATRTKKGLRMINKEKAMINEKEGTINMLTELERMKNNKIFGLHDMLSIKGSGINPKAWETLLNMSDKTKEEIRKEIEEL